MLIMFSWKFWKSYFSCKKNCVLQTYLMLVIIRKPDQSNVIMSYFTFITPSFKSLIKFQFRIIKYLFFQRMWLSNVKSRFHPEGRSKEKTKESASHQIHPVCLCFFWSNLCLGRRAQMFFKSCWSSLPARVLQVWQSHSLKKSSIFIIPELKFD